MSVYSVDGSNAGKQLKVTCCDDKLPRTFIRPSPVHAQCNVIGIGCEATWAKPRYTSLRQWGKKSWNFVIGILTRLREAIPDSIKGLFYAPKSPDRLCVQLSFLLVVFTTIFIPAVYRTQRKVKYLPPSNSEVKNGLIYTSAPTTCFSWLSQNQFYNFTFTIVNCSVL